MHSATTFGSPRDEVAVIVTITRRAPTTRSIAPPTPSTSLPGTAQFAMSPARAHLERAEHGDVDVAAADHREALGAVEVRRPGQRGDRQLRGVDQVRVELVAVRPRPDAEEPVLGVQDDAGVRAEEPRDEVRDADPEVHDLAGPELAAPRAPRSVP